MQGFLNDKYPLENESAPLTTWKKTLPENQNNPQN